MVYRLGFSLSQFGQCLRSGLPSSMGLAVPRPVYDDGNGLRVFQLGEPVENSRPNNIDERFFTQILLENIESFRRPGLAQTPGRFSLYIVAWVAFVQDPDQRLDSITIPKLSQGLDDSPTSLRMPSLERGNQGLQCESCAYFSQGLGRFSLYSPEQVFEGRGF